MGASFVQLLGFAAGILTSLSLLPQVLKTYKTKSAKDFSWGYLAMLLSGLVLWLIYGALNNDLPLIAANSLSGIFVIIISYFKFRQG